MLDLKDIYSSIKTMDELNQYIIDLHKAIEEEKKRLIEAKKFKAWN